MAPTDQYVDTKLPSTYLVHRPDGYFNIIYEYISIPTNYTLCKNYQTVILFPEVYFVRNFIFTFPNKNPGVISHLMLDEAHCQLSGYVSTQRVG